MSKVPENSQQQQKEREHVAGVPPQGVQLGASHQEMVQLVANVQKEFQRQMQVIHRLIVTNNEKAEASIGQLRSEMQAMVQSTPRAQMAHSERTQETGAVATSHELPNNRNSTEDRGGTASGESLTNSTSHSYPPNPARKIYPLPKFGGEPEQWQTFIEDLRRTTEEFGYSELHNIMRIRESLQGRARATVESLLSSARNVEPILEILEETFGRPEMLIKSQIESVRKLANVQEGNLEQLVEFAVKVNNMATFLRTGKGEHHLNNPTLLSEIVAKLPVMRQMQWAEKCVSMERLPNVEDFSKWLNALRKLANFVSDTLPIANSGVSIVNNKATRETTGKNKGRYALVGVSNSKCSVCQNDCKGVANCGEFHRMTAEERWKWARDLRLCFSCLKPSHQQWKCYNKSKCGVNNCSEQHNKLLHKSEASLPGTGERVASTNLHTATSNRAILFQIVPVKIFGPKGSLLIYALVDDGADVSMLDWDVARYVGIEGKNHQLQVQWLDGRSAYEASQVVKFHISGVNECNKKYLMSGVYLTKGLKLPVQSLPREDIKKYPHICDLPLVAYENVEPKMILGLNHAYLTVPLGTPHASAHAGPIAINTRLGWILYGPFAGENHGVKRSYHARSIEKREFVNSLEELMRKFVDAETCCVKLEATPVMSRDNERAMEIMRSSVHYVNGRYECGLLWREGFTGFPDSYEMALKRLTNLERKMERNKEFAEQYVGVMEDFLTKCYARRLTHTEAGNRSSKTFFLPHFGVENPNKRSVRLVFDAAARCQGVSLNSELIPGPDFNQALIGVLMKFRLERVAVCGDIKEMFLQVAVKREDQESLRFLWRRNSADDVQQYVMTRMIFGAACSPTIVQYVKNAHAEKYRDSDYRAVEAILKHHYVDDYVDCFRTEKEAVEVVRKVKEIHSEAGFHMCKIVSNSILVNQEFGEARNEKVNISADGLERVLGLFWLCATDEFVFMLNFHRVPKQVIEQHRKPTKREVLSVIMSIFDPFGFISNLVITAKIMMQLLWKSGIEWDEKIPDSLNGRWVAWLGELEKVRDFKIPRCYSNKFYCAKKDLHIFSDASEEAMATVAYWRIEAGEETILSFVIGKTNCAPIRSMSVPRLELQAAVLAVRLKNAIVKYHGIEIDSVSYWSDSHTVIRWVKSDSRVYKQFVANRIAEILESSEESQWRWVPGILNPADEATRAKPTFDPNSRWKNGPAFLLQPRTDWPTEPTNAAFAEHDEEMRSRFVLTTRQVSRLIFDVNRFSNYSRLRMAIGWVFRYVCNLKKRTKGERLLSGKITAEEVNVAEVYMWRSVQRMEFENEYQRLSEGESVESGSELKTLNPFIDEKGLIRSSGRIDNAPYLQWETKRPIILPKNHRMTRLLVIWYHQRLHHVNVQTVISEIRLKYWIPAIRVLVNSVFSQCRSCKLRKAKPSPPIMGLLPADRLTAYQRPFAYSGVDLFGPVEVTIRRQKEKRWVALFTCMAVRAVHLEVVADLSSDAFLVCVRNFVNRRGVPVQLRSDNGTNFVGLGKELSKEDKFLDHDDVTKGLAPLGIKWKFNTPANPSEGGVWERLVQSVKRALSTVMKEQAPRLETLISLLIECENIVNSRPLTHLPVTPSDPEPLTPNHFLLGCPNSTQTPAPFENRLCSLRKQWRILQNLKNLFWQRWIREYLPELTRRTKWCRPSKPLTRGALVLVCEPDLPRSQWKRGRVVQLTIGPDGVARSAEVETASGTLRRPVSRLAPLDVESSGECPESIHGGGGVVNATLI